MSFSASIVNDDNTPSTHTETSSFSQVPFATIISESFVQTSRERELLEPIELYSPPDDLSTCKSKIYCHWDHELIIDNTNGSKTNDELQKLIETFPVYVKPGFIDIYKNETTEEELLHNKNVTEDDPQSSLPPMSPSSNTSSSGGGGNNLNPSSSLSSDVVVTPGASVEDGVTKNIRKSKRVPRWKLSLDRALERKKKKEQTITLTHVTFFTFATFCSHECMCAYDETFLKGKYRHIIKMQRYYKYGIPIGDPLCSAPPPQIMLTKFNGKHTITRYRELFTRCHEKMKRCQLQQLKWEHQLCNQAHIVPCTYPAVFTNEMKKPLYESKNMSSSTSSSSSTTGTVDTKEREGRAAPVVSSSSSSLKQQHQQSKMPSVKCVPLLLKRKNDISSVDGGLSKKVTPTIMTPNQREQSEHREDAELERLRVKKMANKPQPMQMKTMPSTTCSTRVVARTAMVASAESTSTSSTSSKPSNSNSNSNSNSLGVDEVSNIPTLVVDANDPTSNNLITYMERLKHYNSHRIKSNAKVNGVKYSIMTDKDPDDDMKAPAPKRPRHTTHPPSHSKTGHVSDTPQPPKIINATNSIIAAQIEPHRSTPRHIVQNRTTTGGGMTQVCSNTRNRILNKPFTQYTQKKQHMNQQKLEQACKL